MLNPGTFVTAVCMISIFGFINITFVVLKDQIAARKTGIITTRYRVYDRSKSRFKYYSIVVFRIFLLAIFGLISVFLASTLKYASHRNLIDRNVFAVSALLVPAVGIWVFRIKEPLNAFVKGYTGKYEERFRGFVQRHIILMTVVIPVILMIVDFVVRVYFRRPHGA